MQRELERDPQYAPLFATIGTLPTPLPVDALAQRTVEIMRDAAHADVALSTASSFRQDLPRGRVTMESLRAAMPYDNEILVYTLRGDAVEKLLAYGKSRRGQRFVRNRRRAEGDRSGEDVSRSDDGLPRACSAGISRFLRGIDRGDAGAARARRSAND